MDTIEEILKKYATEIHGDHAAGMDAIYFLKHLISSHRHLRSLNLENREQWHQTLESERQKAFNFAKDYALQNNWFAKEHLGTMTLKELAEILYEGE